MTPITPLTLPSISDLFETEAGTFMVTKQPTLLQDADYYGWMEKGFEVLYYIPSEDVFEEGVVHIEGMLNGDKAMIILAGNPWMELYVFGKNKKCFSLPEPKFLTLPS